MFQAARIRSARFLYKPNSKNLSSLNKNATPTDKAKAAPNVTNTTASTKKKTSPVLVYGVALLASGSVFLVLNASNETLIAQLDKHAPIVNTILTPFRPPAVIKPNTAVQEQVFKPKELAVNDTAPEIKQQNQIVETANNDKKDTTPEVMRSSAEAVSPVIVELPTVEEVEEAVSSSQANAVAAADEDAELNELVAEVEEILASHSEYHHQAQREAAQVEVGIIPEGVDKIAWLVALRGKDDAQFYNALKELTAEEIEQVWTQSNATTSSDSTQLATDGHGAHSSLLHHELQSQARTILSELQNELHRQHERDLEIKYSRDLKDALAAQASELEARKMEEMAAVVESVQQQMTAEANHNNARIHRDAVQSLLAIQPKVADLEAQLHAFETITAETAEAVRATLDAHRISSAVLALELALSHYGATTNVESSLQMLRDTCRSDALVMSVIDSLPKRVLQHGALNSSELQVRFNIMRNEVRKVALAPEEAPKMIGAAIGHFLAKITWVPKGFLTGQGVEDALARADYYLERGRVKEALGELEGVTGYSSVLMEDFKALARDRLVVDQSISVLKAKSIVRHKSFVEK